MIEAPVKEPRDLQGPVGVEVQVVSRTFRTRRGEVAALDGVSMSAGAGEIVAVVGPSGCGKSTLLELICGLQTPDAGTVAAAPAALMPQRDLLLPWLTAVDNAALALRAKGIRRDQARAAAQPWLERFGLTGFERSRPAELSGGMRQRVAFLRTLLAGKPVLALDEPFASLDAITRSEMQGWLAQVLEAEPRTVVLVTHDVEEAVILADRVLVMSPRPGRVDITSTRSARITASSTSWVTSTTVRGSASSTWASHPCISLRVIASSEANGSSSASTGLPANSVRRNATRWRIPPDSSAGRDRSNPVRPKRSSHGWAAARAWSRRIPLARSASAALSTAVSHGSNRSRWGINAAGAAATVPASGVCRPQISSSSVDLPQPLGPTTATISPAPADIETPSSAATSPRLVR